jgi:short-subunit dehydrogenase
MKAVDARVLLTGASGGIGRAAADALVQAGAGVLLAGRSPARVATQARELMHRFRQPPARIGWHAANLDSAAEIAALARTAVEWGCNAIVHNAGVPSFGRLESLAAEEIERTLRTNLLAPMLLTQALLPHLQRLPRAQLIFVGSALGRIGVPGFSAYAASKFGLRGFAEALRRELADTAVRVQYLGPRGTHTDFNSSSVRAYQRATGAAMDAPEAIAHALVQLLEDGAAERFVGWPEKLAVRINGLAPALLDPAFARHRRHLPPKPSEAVSRPAV